jgi:hypothetical protein
MMREPEDHAPGRPDSRWCWACSTPEGELQPFEERFAKLVDWTMRRDGIPRTEAETEILTFLRGMPLWRDHPAVAGTD